MSVMPCMYDKLFTYIRKQYNTMSVFQSNARLREGCYRRGQITSREYRGGEAAENDSHAHLV